MGRRAGGGCGLGGSNGESYENGRVGAYGHGGESRAVRDEGRWMMEQGSTLALPNGLSQAGRAAAAATIATASAIAILVELAGLVIAPNQVWRRHKTGIGNPRYPLPPSSPNSAALRVRRWPLARLLYHP